MFKKFKDKVMGLYTRNTHTPPPRNMHAPVRNMHVRLIINLTEDQTRVKSYKVTGNLNHEVSDLILSTIKTVIEMQTEVVYSFSCWIYQG